MKQHLSFLKSCGACGRASQLLAQSAGLISSLPGTVQCLLKTNQAATPTLGPFSHLSSLLPPPVYSAFLDSESIHRNSRRLPPILNSETTFVTPYSQTLYPFSLSLCLSHLALSFRHSFLLAFLWLNSGTLPGKLKQLNKVHPVYRTEARREYRAKNLNEALLCNCPQRETDPKFVDLINDFCLKDIFS